MGALLFQDLPFTEEPETTDCINSPAASIIVLAGISGKEVEGEL